MAANNKPKSTMFPTLRRSQNKEFQVPPRILSLRALCRPINNNIKWELYADRRYLMNIKIIALNYKACTCICIIRRMWYKWYLAHCATLFTKSVHVT